MAIQINGSLQAVSLGDGYALRAVGFRGTVDTQSVGPRAGGAAARSSAAAPLPLEEALQATGVTEIRRFDLQLQPIPGSSGAILRGAGAGAELEFDVPERPGEGQVVLSVDDAGAMRWHLPEPAAAPAAATTTSRAPGVKRFRIPAIVLPPPIDAGPRRERSVLGAAGRRLLRVLVYPLADPIVGALGKGIAGRWESEKRPHRLRRFSPSDYASPDAPVLTAGDIAAMAAAGPVLLFVHGTFSTSHGAFGGLPAATLATLHERYGGRVVAFDHPTIATDPRENVRWLLSHWPATPTNLDIICHSRGGLVSRILAEKPPAFDLDGAGIEVRRLLLAGVPNQGTLLANPDHMVDMVDRLTTVLNLFPTGPVTETLEALITLVKVLAHGALHGLGGLASMHPGGDLLKTLNASAMPSSQYFGIASNYEPTDRGLRALVSRAGDIVIDKVFDGAGNDLVVPTEGVFHENGSNRFPLPAERLLRFEPSDGVMHTTLFIQPSVSERILSWLA